MDGWIDRVYKIKCKGDEIHSWSLFFVLQTFVCHAMFVVGSLVTEKCYINEFSSSYSLYLSENHHSAICRREKEGGGEMECWMDTRWSEGRTKGGVKRGCWVHG